MSTIAEQLFEEGYKEGFEIGYQEGLQEGYQQGFQLVKQAKLTAIEVSLYIKFGEEGLREFKEIRKIEDIKVLYKIREALKQVKKLDELRQVYRSR